MGGTARLKLFGATPKYRQYRNVQLSFQDELNEALVTRLTRGNVKELVVLEGVSINIFSSFTASPVSIEISGFLKGQTGEYNKCILTFIPGSK